MSRKPRSRKQPRKRPRKSKSRAALLPAAFGGALGRRARHDEPVGWQRFAAGIVIGATLGVAAALFVDWPILDAPGTTNVVIAAPSPESRDPSTGAKVTIEPPEVVEQAGAATPAPQAAAAPAPSAPAPQQPAPQPVALVTPEPAPAAQAKPVPQPQPEPAPLQVATVGIVDHYSSGGAGDPAWLRNSVAFSVPRGHPVIAIVLDDVGVNRAQAEQAMKLPPEITLSFMTYADGVAEMSARARARGHELMVHVPMEPMGGEIDPGPKALKVGLSDAEILARLRWGLDRFDGYIGINNHMGSRFTQDARGMQVVMDELKRRDLLWLDSRTIASSVGDSLAARTGVAHVSRDVFLDDDMSGAAVERQLAEAERVARQTGQVIAIGHPHPATIAAIKAWLPRAKARGFVIAPVSVVAKRQIGVSG